MSIRSQASDGEPRQAPDPAVVRYIHSLAAIVYGPQALTTESGPQGPALQKLRYEAIRTLAAAPVDSPGGAHSMELGEMEGILRIECMDEWHQLEVSGSSVWDELPDIFTNVLRMETVGGLGPRGRGKGDFLILDVPRLEAAAEHASSVCALMRLHLNDPPRDDPHSLTQEATPIYKPGPQAAHPTAHIPAGSSRGSAPAPAAPHLTPAMMPGGVATAGPAGNASEHGGVSTTALTTANTTGPASYSFSTPTAPIPAPTAPPDMPARRVTAPASVGGGGGGSGAAALLRQQLPMLAFPGNDTVSVIRRALMAELLTRKTGPLGPFSMMAAEMVPVLNRDTPAAWVELMCCRPWPTLVAPPLLDTGDVEGGTALRINTEALLELARITTGSGSAAEPHAAARHVSAPDPVANRSSSTVAAGSTSRAAGPTPDPAAVAQAPTTSGPAAPATPAVITPARGPSPQSMLLATAIHAIAPGAATGQYVVLTHAATGAAQHPPYEPAANEAASAQTARRQTAPAAPAPAAATVAAAHAAAAAATAPLDRTPHPASRTVSCNSSITSNRGVTDNSDPHAAMIAKLSSKRSSNSGAAPPPTGPTPPVPPHLLRLSSKVFRGTDPLSMLRRLAVSKLAVAGVNQPPRTPLGPHSMSLSELSSEFRLAAQQDFSALEQLVAQRQPAHWAGSDPREKLRASRMGVLLVDVPGFVVRELAPGQLVVQLDEAGLAAAAGEPALTAAQHAPASAGSGAVTVGEVEAGRAMAAPAAQHAPAAVFGSGYAELQTGTTAPGEPGDAQYQLHNAPRHLHAGLLGEVGLASTEVSAIEWGQAPQGAWAPVQPPAQLTEQHAGGQHALAAIRNAGEGGMGMPSEAINANEHLPAHGYGPSAAEMAAFTVPGSHMPEQQQQQDVGSALSLSQVAPPPPAAPELPSAPPVTTITTAETPAIFEPWAPAAPELPSAPPVSVTTKAAISPAPAVPQVEHWAPSGPTGPIETPVLATAHAPAITAPPAPVLSTPPPPVISSPPPASPAFEAMPWDAVPCTSTMICGAVPYSGTMIGEAVLLTPAGPDPATEAPSGAMPSKRHSAQQSEEVPGGQAGPGPLSASAAEAHAGVSKLDSALAGVQVTLATAPGRMPPASACSSAPSAPPALSSWSSPYSMPEHHSGLQAPSLPAAEALGAGPPAAGPSSAPAAPVESPNPFLRGIKEAQIAVAGSMPGNNNRVETASSSAAAVLKPSGSDVGGAGRRHTTDSTGHTTRLRPDASAFVPHASTPAARFAAAVASVARTTSAAAGTVNNNEASSRAGLQPAPVMRSTSAAASSVSTVTTSSSMRLQPAGSSSALQLPVLVTPPGTPVEEVARQGLDPQTLHASRCAAAVFGGDDSVSQIKRALARYLAGCAGPTSGPLGPHSMKMSDLGKVLEKIAPQATQKARQKHGHSLAHLFASDAAPLSLQPAGITMAVVLDMPALVTALPQDLPASGTKQSVGPQQEVASSSLAQSSQQLLLLQGKEEQHQPSASTAGAAVTQPVAQTTPAATSAPAHDRPVEHQALQAPVPSAPAAHKDTNAAAAACTGTSQGFTCPQAPAAATPTAPLPLSPIPTNTPATETTSPSVTGHTAPLPPSPIATPAARTAPPLPGNEHSVAGIPALTPPFGPNMVPPPSTPAAPPPTPASPTYTGLEARQPDGGVASLTTSASHTPGTAAPSAVATPLMTASHAFIATPVLASAGRAPTPEGGASMRASPGPTDAGTGTSDGQQGQKFSGWEADVSVGHQDQEPAQQCTTGGEQEQEQQHVEEEEEVPNWGTSSWSPQKQPSPSPPPSRLQPLAPAQLSASATSESTPATVSAYNSRWASPPVPYSQTGPEGGSPHAPGESAGQEHPAGNVNVNNPRASATESDSQATVTRDQEHSMMPVQDQGVGATRSASPSMLAPAPTAATAPTSAATGDPSCNATVPAPIAAPPAPTPAGDHRPFWSGAAASPLFNTAEGMQALLFASPPVSSGADSSAAGGPSPLWGYGVVTGSTRAGSAGDDATAAAAVVRDGGDDTTSAAKGVEEEGWGQNSSGHVGKCHHISAAVARDKEAGGRPAQEEGTGETLFRQVMGGDEELEEGEITPSWGLAEDDELKEGDVVSCTSRGPVQAGGGPDDLHLHHHHSQHTPAQQITLSSRSSISASGAGDKGASAPDWQLGGRQQHVGGYKESQEHEVQGQGPWQEGREELGVQGRGFVQDACEVQGQGHWQAGGKEGEGQEREEEEAPAWDAEPWEGGSGDHTARTNQSHTSRTNESLTTRTNKSSNSATTGVNAASATAAVASAKLAPFPEPASASSQPWEHRHSSASTATSASATAASLHATQPTSLALTGAVTSEGSEAAMLSPGPAGVTQPQSSSQAPGTPPAMHQQPPVSGGPFTDGHANSSTAPPPTYAAEPAGPAAVSVLSSLQGYCSPVPSGRGTPPPPESLTPQAALESLRAYGTPCSVADSPGAVTQQAGPNMSPQSRDVPNSAQSQHQQQQQEQEQGGCASSSPAPHEGGGAATSSEDDGALLSLLLGA